MTAEELNGAVAGKLRRERDDLVMLSELEGKVARVLWPGIDVWHEWMPEGRELVRRSIARLRQIFREESEREGGFAGHIIGLEMGSGRIANVLQLCRGDRKAAAQQLGIDVQTLDRWIERYGL